MYQYVTLQSPFILIVNKYLPRFTVIQFTVVFIQKDSVLLGKRTSSASFL